MPTNDMCRICLTDPGGSKMTSLFDNLDLIRKIEEIGGVELKPHADFPSKLCPICLNMLDTSYKFRKMLIASENAYLDFIGLKAEPKTEPQDIDFIEETNDTLSSSGSARSEGEIFFAEFIDAREVEDLAEINEEFEQTQNEFTDFDIDTNDQTIEYLVSDDESIQSILNEEIKKKKKRGDTKTKGMTNKTKMTVYDVNERKPPKGSNKFFDNQPQTIMCEICGNIYSRRSLLNLHMRRHLSDKPFECEICAKTFPCSSEIRRHMRTHTGEKPYICKYCGRTFADRSTNIKHERIHTNERPFACNTCGKTFTYSNVLKNHMLTHTGEKPFSCVACNKTFSRKHQLDQHCSTIIHQQTVRALSKVNMVSFPSDDGGMNISNVTELLNTAEN